MRLKSIFIGSTSAMALALLASPAAAQVDPAAAVDEQGVPVDAEASTEEAAVEEDTIVVTGLRRSIQSAQALKRNSDQIVDAIVAEDIGKLPDITASASLARITGVQVTRAAGEAADVQVRGLPDLSTTYNGRDIFTAENRSVALQDFPAGGVAALEVYKSSTANLIEGGVAGQINVRSRRPFDFDGFEAFGAISGVLFDESQDVVPNANLLLSNRWDTGMGEFGILLNVAVAKTNFLDSNREQADFIAVARADQTSQPGFRFPDTQAIFFGQGNRTRPSVNGAIQWRPDSKLEITFDGLFQGYRGRDFNQFRRFNLFGDSRFSNVELEADGIRARRVTVTNAPPPFGFAEFRNVDTDTYQFGGNIRWRGDDLRIAGDVAYTDSTFEEDQTNVDSILLGVQSFEAIFDTDGEHGGPTFDIGNYNINDPNNYQFEGLFERRRLAKGDDIQARVDAEYDLDMGFLSMVQAGVRFSDRDASRQDGGRFTFIGNRGIRFSDPSIPVDFRITDPGFSFDNVMRVRTLVSPDRKSLWDNIEALRTFVGAPVTAPDYEPQNSFQASEKTYTGYGQIKYAFDAGFPIDGLIGVRAVRTESEITGTQRVFGPGGVAFVPLTRSQEYTDYLPNASIRLEFMPELQLRAAFTETRTRPRFDQLNPSANIDPPPSCQTNNDPSDDANCFRTGNGGNPNLRLLESDNYDLSLEYYFARAGSATLALFRRDVNGFIADASVEFIDPQFGRLRFVSPDNGGDGFLQGIELGFTSFFDYEFVPTWAHGFGIQANYTYIDNGAELPPRLIDGVPATEGLFPGKPDIEDVSKHSYNLVGLYEDKLFSARLAYNYRGKFTDFYQRFFDPGAGRDRIAPVIQEGRGVLDFAASITPVENITLAFDATNLLGNPIKTFREFNGAGGFFDRQRRYLERTYAVTLRVRY